MKKWSRLIKIAIFGPLLCLLWLPDTAQAFPAFARTYQVPCSTCHVVFTRRNEFGDAFRKNGYRWPGEPEYDKNAKNPAPIDMPGVSLWEGLLPTTWPFSAVMSFSGDHTTDPNAPQSFNVGSPGVKLLFGSTLSDHLAVMGIWSPSGAPSEFVLQASRLFDRPELNIRIGKIEPTTTMFKTNEQMVSTFLLTSSNISGLTMGGPKLGAELNGTVMGRIFYAAGTVKSNANNGDQFNTYYHLSGRVGGTSFSGEEPDIDLDDPSFIDDVSFTLGHWGYFGSIAGSGGVSISRVARFGLDAKIGIPEFELWGGVMLGIDHDMTKKIADEDGSGSSHHPEELHVTFFGEALWSATSWLFPSYMFQFQDRASLSRPTQKHSLGVFFLPIENLRVSLVYNLESSDNADATLGKEGDYLGTGKAEIRMGF